MTGDEARRLIERYKQSKGKPTPSEYMAYMFARRQIGDYLTAGQRGFLDAASKQKVAHETDQDRRVQCIACAHLRNGWCKNAIAAGFGKKPEHQIGKELAVLKQDCPGYKEKK